MKYTTIQKIYNKFLKDDEIKSLTFYINTRKQVYINKKDKVLITNNEVIINEKIAIDNDIIKIIE